MSFLSKAIASLQNAMIDEEIAPQEGLPLDLFELATTLLPFVNVDLLVESQSGQILLSWRDDRHYGRGWQIPGGIIRMMETIDERIQKTAMREIGCEVEYDDKPIAICENLIRERREGLANQLERAHNISLLYKCKIPEGYVINNGEKKENDDGYLKWFDEFPEDLLECHRKQRQIIELGRHNQRWQRRSRS